MCVDPGTRAKAHNLAETWQYIEDPINYIMETNGLLQQKISGSSRTQESVEEMNQQLGKAKSQTVKNATPPGVQQWNGTFEEKMNSTKTKDLQL